MSGSVCKRHTLGCADIPSIRKNLLVWYDKKKRTLPWREMALEEDPNKRGYAVWVSEIMLQQTQVATVINYYNRWMQKWPTVQDLAEASLEEVHEMWAGLGYYSRGTRLHEAAKKVVSELDGEMPRTAEQLNKQLPGVGRYTAGAVASIAFNQVTGLVDGNVSRVFARLCAIGCDITSQHATDHLWEHANRCVDEERPGDYNQGLMELGAMLCTPKSPDCPACPLTSHCSAYQQVADEKSRSAKRLQCKNENVSTDKPAIEDIEDVVEGCKLCFGAEDNWESSLGVENYPRKGKKKAARRERTSVCVCERLDESGDKVYLITQRPQKGLLAGLWEFPSIQVGEENKDSNLTAILEYVQSTFSIDVAHLQRQRYIAEVVHLFSHIHQTYVVNHVTVTSKAETDLTGSERPAKWVSREEFLQSAVSTAMKKVFKAFETNDNKALKSVSKRKSGGSAPADDKQPRLHAFFKPKSKA